MLHYNQLYGLSSIVCSAGSQYIVIGEMFEGKSLQREEKRAHSERRAQPLSRNPVRKLQRRPL